MPDVPRRAHSEPERRGLLKAFFRPSRGQFAIGIALFLTAFIVVITLKSQAAQPEFANVRQADLIQLLDNVTSETRRLETEVRELEQARTDLQSGADRQEAAREDAARRLDQARIIAGTVPVTGPGIQIRIDDPQGKVTPELLLDAVEELRDAGAEVIELNDSVRLVMDSWFGSAADGTILVGSQTISAPYLIEVIGDPATLEAGARFRGGLVSQIEGDRVGGQATITQSEALAIDSVVTVEESEFAKPR
ncbi:MAG TPA: DUF881 domain-containing protein [Tessaracoccus flavescens]|uniref:DUF881 domain-containing protein n=1 Tax=Tessaracoccus flavescens TaxID=399497 RepID=A0A921JPM1_9ACTN|nr:DUF881 domain-containing protein [Tessaracoccus flavescens]